MKSVQHEHLPSGFRDLVVRIEKAYDLSYPVSVDSELLWRMSKLYELLLVAEKTSATVKLQPIVQSDCSSLITEKDHLNS